MKKSIYAAAAVFLLLAVGCDTMAGPESGTGADQNGRVAVSLVIAGTDSRSVLPAVPAVDAVARWRLRGGKTSESQDWLTDLFADPEDEILYLETGEWDFTLEGYQDEFGATLILEGTIKGQTISLGRSNTLEFIVAPLAEGTGTVTIVIKLPGGHGIDQVKVYQGGQELTLELPITPVENQIVFTNDYAAGDYYFSFRLYKGEDLYGVVSELVSVRQNLTSATTYTLGQEDLNLRYLITYHLNGGDFEEGVLNPASYRYTEAVVLSQPAIRSDYEFKGWYDNAALKGEPVTNISTRSTGDKTFWAQWVRQYTITFETHGGSPVNPITQDENTTVNEPAEPAKDGFRFLGWFSQADGGTEYDDWPYTLTGNVTMHAQWKPPASILITLHPSSKPSIISTKTEISINQGATFTIETGSTDIAWHWNGERIPEQTAASYTLEPYSIRRPGIYELSVVVTEGGEKLSAWCRVIIMAEGGR